VSDPIRGEVAYRYVPMGTTAPDPVPSDELWLDVGNRAGPGVLDHHGGDTDAWSAADIVLRHHREMIGAHVRDAAAVTFVLHGSPDADSVCAAWMARHVLLHGDLPGPPAAVGEIVRRVSENDQGYVRAQVPRESWIIIFRTYLRQELGDSPTAGEMESAFRILDKTSQCSSQGVDLDACVEEMLTVRVRKVLLRAERDYQDDVSRSSQFQVRLPRDDVMTDDPRSVPRPSPDTWTVADGVFVENPTSALFRELARGDTANSQSGSGFAFMFVSMDDDDITGSGSLARHILSTNPSAGLHLQGLGATLEAREQQREDELGGSLRNSRRRVPDGEGRHGYNVESPWYDGRGHHFTIVDSPAIDGDRTHVCGSVLSSDDVLDALWEYGALVARPARGSPGVEPIGR